MSGTSTRAGRSPGLSLGRIGGVPVVLAWSWFIITAFIVVVFGPRVGALFPSIGVLAYGVALGYALLLALSVLIHELAHALTARVFGWPSTEIVLNLWGGHTQFASHNASPGRSLLVALAGPTANFVLAGLGWALLTALTPGSVGYLLATILVWANLLIGVFNVLPGLPLDGGRLVESIVWRATGSQEKGTVAAGWAGRVIVIVLLGVLIGVPFLRGLRPDLLLIVIAVVMGAFLWMGAGAAIQGARMRLRLPTIRARALQHPARSLPAGSTVSDARAALRADPETAVVLVDGAGRPEAVLDPGALQAVQDSAAGTTPASAAARRLAAGAYVPEDAAGQELLQFLTRVEGKEYAVVDDQGAVTGILHQQRIVRALTGKTPPTA